jgi:hypothetical protein
MMKVTAEAETCEGIRAQLRMLLDQFEKGGAGGGGSVPADRVARMRSLLGKLTTLQRRIIDRHAQGRCTANELAVIAGGKEELRGVNAGISSLAKRCGLTYDEIITRDYSNYSSVGTEYDLTPTFAAVVSGA